MFDFNWVDLIAVILLVSSVYTGIRIGALSLLTVVGAFFGTLVISGWLYPRLLPIEDRTLLTITNTNLVMLTALIAGSYSLKLNRHLHDKFSSPVLRKLDTAAGGLVGFLAVGTMIWLLISVVVRSPFVNVSNEAHNATTTQVIREILPWTPSIFATFNNHVNPNNPPFLFYNEASEARYAYSKDTYNQIIRGNVADSVVSVSGFGCGGTLSGTGFVVRSDLVLTNAHVIAGITRPVVKYANASFEAVPVLFNASLDFAVLKVVQPERLFNAPALELMDEMPATGSTVGIVGFPDGRFTAVPGVIHEHVHVPGRNIYDVGLVSRDVYVVQTETSQGISGGPVVTRDGQVAGMVFSRAYQRKDLVYALSAPQLKEAVGQVNSANKRVSTGVCVAN